jgi:energy-converting hydrogenase Eha subunit E
MTTEAPAEATRRPHVSALPSDAQSKRTRWSRARLVTVGILITATVTPAASRPISGADLMAVPTALGGSLIVLNTDRRDAVLVFMAAGMQKRAVYIRAGERLQMLDVEPGTYRIWIASGGAWSHDHFATDQMFQELDEPLTFDTHGTTPQTVVIATPGDGTGSVLHVRAPFPLNLRD